MAAAGAGAAGQIAVQPEKQTMTHEQLIAHVGEQHAAVAADVAPAGLTAEHSAMITAMIQRTHATMAGVTATNQYGVQCVGMFADQESNNEQAVDGMESSTPSAAC